MTLPIRGCTNYNKITCGYTVASKDAGKGTSEALRVCLQAKVGCAIGTTRLMVLANRRYRRL
jgi:hypothetical protein